MNEPNWSEDAAIAGSMGNTVLYRMAKEHPSHLRAEIVRDKMLIIGRVYSAAVTRGAGSKGQHVEDDGEGLYGYIAKRLVSEGDDLDIRIENCRRNGRVSRTTIRDAIETHTFLNRIIVDAIKAWRGNNTGDRNVWARGSFASKYLHFHAPMAFFILDSIVTGTLRHLRPAHARTKWPDGYDAAHRTPYGTHCFHLLDCADRHYSGIDWTPRLIDGHLMGYISTDVPIEIARARSMWIASKMKSGEL